MHRIDGDGHASNLFTDGDPGTGVPATLVTAAWANDTQEEIVNVILAANLTLVKGTQTQLLAALARLNPVKAFARITTNGSGSYTLGAAKNVQFGVGEGLTTSGIVWSYTTPFVSNPAVIASVKDKSSGFYVACHDPMGDPTTQGRLKFKDNTGAAVNPQTTPIEFYFVVLGNFF